MDNLWNQSSNNELPPIEEEFDEHKDALEALAEQALQKELLAAKLKKQKAREGNLATEGESKAG